MDVTFCPSCNEMLRPGDWPWCPHGQGTMEAIEDSIPGGMVVENMSHEPFTVYSQTEFRAAADKHNVRLRDCWAGPGDRYLSNWAAVSPKTLADAKAMLERVGRVSADQPRATLETLQVTVGPWRAS